MLRYSRIKMTLFLVKLLKIKTAQYVQYIVLFLGCNITGHQEKFMGQYIIISMVWTSWDQL